MARTTSTNFTAGLDFTLATAGTDLFKKEDVEILAQAVDLHDHTSGKGLALPSGYVTSAMIADGTIATGDLADGAVTSLKIADGTITSADIADGTIATTDIAANAVTQLIGSYAAAPTFSTTTSGGAWVTTPVSTGAITCSGARVRITCAGSLNHSVAGTPFFVALVIDATPTTAFVAINQPVAGYNVPFAFEYYYVPTAGSHTFAMAVAMSTAGTLLLSNQVLFTLYVTEEKR